MKYLFIICIIISATSCIIDSTNLESDVNCEAANFIGHWKYQSTNGVVLDSIPDIEITETDDESSRDIIIDGRSYYIKSVSGCTAGEVSGLVDVTYELISENELHKNFRTFLVFGSTSIYKKE